jgi:hypothetical protein
MTIGYYQDSHKIIEIILLSTSAISFIAGSLILFYSGTLILASMRITLAWIRKLEKENG